jgi:hypothetical protein
MGDFFPKIFPEISKQFSYKVFFSHTRHRGDYPPYLGYYRGRGGRGDTRKDVGRGYGGCLVGGVEQKTPL